MKRTALALASVLALTGAATADWRDDAVKLVKQEPKVVEAAFPGPVSFWASVQDDGSNRDGFANYLCLVLADAGMPEGASAIVHVWDAASMPGDGEMRELGQADCRR